MQTIDIAVVCIGAFFSVLALVNGVYMLASPRAWWRLPQWLRASGGLSERNYSSGWGALQIRIGGGLIVAFFVMTLGSIIYDEFIRLDEAGPRGGPLSRFLEKLPWPTNTWVLFVVLTPFMLINGVVMLASPSAWDRFPKWLKVAGVPDPSETSSFRFFFIRLIGAFILFCVIWILNALPKI